MRKRTELSQFTVGEIELSPEGKREILTLSLRPAIFRAPITRLRDILLELVE